MVDLHQIYLLLVDTLIRVCPEFTLLSDVEIEEYLSELEGDYYTFFDSITLLPLLQLEILTLEQKNNIVQLKKVINEIPAHQWSKKSFVKEVQWFQAKELANSILNSLGIDKRII